MTYRERRELTARMIVVNIQTSMWTPDEAAKAEKAWSLRVHLHRKYTDIATELGFEGTEKLLPGEVAMEAVERFQAEIDAGLRSEPPDPKRRRPRR